MDKNDGKDGARRYGEIGLIQRKDFGTVPPKVSYRLTPLGERFVPVINSIRKWGTRHLSVTA
ncbi:winged helix-turn-helix transcriptional regulator [Reyranella sp.]|uniref:winged helix-turn-helix transcriptional regulator n=1 Tax=Reyranella sp. TaxID=1929291 RepID=UPI003D0D144E